MILSLSPRAADWMRRLGLSDGLEEIATGAPAQSLFSPGIGRRPSQSVVHRVGELCEASPRLVCLNSAELDWSHERERLAALAGTGTRWVDWRPGSLREILEFGLRIGKALGQLDRVMPLMGAAERLLWEWRSEVGIARRAPDDQLPRVALLSEGPEPVAAGWWAREFVDRAAALLVPRSESGEPRRLTLDELSSARPDVVIVAGDGSQPVSEALVTWCTSNSVRLIRYRTGAGLLEASPHIVGAARDVMSIVHGKPEVDLAGRVQYLS